MISVEACNLNSKDIVSWPKGLQLERPHLPWDLVLASALSGCQGAASTEFLTRSHLRRLLFDFGLSLSKAVMTHLKAALVDGAQGGAMQSAGGRGTAGPWLPSYTVYMAGSAWKH